MSIDEARLKRIRIRAWRRGTKEMDLILGGFVDRNLNTLNAQDLDALEAMMNENDQDLYLWITGQAQIPPVHSAIIARIAQASGMVFGN